MTEYGRRIIEALEEALRHARGEPTEVRVTTYVVRKGVRTRADGIPEIFREVRRREADPHG